MPVGVPQRALHHGDARREQVRQLGYQIRPCPAEALDHCVRGKGHIAVLSAGNIGQQLKDCGVGFLDVVNQDHLQPVPFRLEEPRGILEDLPCGRDDSSRIESLGHAQVQDVAVLRIKGCSSNPVRPAAFMPEPHQVIRSPP
jgi:hypothetical protein